MAILDITQMLRKERESLLTLWKERLGHSSELFERYFERFGKTLFALVLDGIENEEFDELEHFLDRSTAEGIEDGVGLSELMRAFFLLRVALSERANSIEIPHQLRATFHNRLIDQFDRGMTSLVLSYHGRAIDVAASEMQGKYLAEVESLRQAPVAIAVTDASGRILKANHRFQNLVSLSEDELSGKRVKELLDRGAKKLRDAMIECQDGHSRQIDGIRLGGDGMQVLVTVGAVQLHRGEVGGEKRLAVIVFIPAPGEVTPPDMLLTGLKRIYGTGEKLGAKVKRLRRGLHLSLTVLAERVPMARGYLSNIENGKCVPSFEKFHKLCEALDPDGAEGLLALCIAEKLPPALRELL